MQAEFKQVNLTLTSEEVWDILFCIIGDVKHSVESHWVNFIDGKSKEEFIDYIKDTASEKLKMISTLSNLLDRPDIYEGVFYSIEEIWKNATT